MNREQRLTQDGAEDPILFYSVQKPPWSCFSNFSHHEVVLMDPWTRKARTYRRSEYRFAALKATNQHDHDAICACVTPGEAKDLGGQIALREDWGSDLNTVCWFVMVEALIAKTMQHLDVQEALIATGDRYIYEDSPVDDIWGWRYGQSYTGKNLLGLAWMHTRAILLG